MNLLPNLNLLAAETAGDNAGLFQALGIDVRLLLLQAAAFLLLAFLLGKYVFPYIIRAIDKRQEQMEAGVKASEAAQKKAEAAQAEVEKQLKEARKQADEIIETAHKEAVDMVAAAEKRAQTKATHIVTEARASLSNEVDAARKALRRETSDLVLRATEKIIGEKLDAKKDGALIERALKEIR